MPYLSKEMLTRRAMALLAASIAVGAALAAAAEPPLPKSIGTELASLRRAPRALDAELALFAIFDQWDRVGPEAVVAGLDAALEIEGLGPSARERAHQLRAEASLRLGDPAAARAAWRRQGFIRHWWVLGPFDNEGATGFATRFSAEAAATDPFDASVAAPDGRNGPVEWRPVDPRGVLGGRLELAGLMEPTQNVCAYALSVLNAEKAGQATLLIGAGGAVRAYWNGVPAIEDDRYLGPDPDRFGARVEVRAGTNRLLVKVCADEHSTAGLYARLTDRNLRAWPVAPPVDAPRARTFPPIEPGPRARPLVRPLEALTRRGERDSTPTAMATAATYAQRTGALHQGSHRARDLARGACRQRASVDRCLLWSSLAADRNERRRAIERALDANPRSPSALLALARIEQSGNEPFRATALIERALVAAPGDLEAHLLSIELEADLGFTFAAFGRIEALVDEHPRNPSVLRLAADLAERGGLAARAIELTRSYLKVRFDDRARHEVLLRAAAGRGDTAAFARRRAALLNVAGIDAGILARISALQEGLGEHEPAEQLLRWRVKLRPGDAAAHKALGQYLLRRGDRERGLASLERSLALEPQDAWLADYLEHLRPVPRFEDPHLVPAAEFLSRRGALADGEDARYLVDNTVVRVFDSGLSSRFTQLVVEVGSRETARDWRRHSIQLTPSSQRVKLIAARVFRPDGTVELATGRGVVPIAEPWYRLYYDLEAEVVELPPLAPGDVVEYRYRVDDTGERNVFADYFGDLALLQGSHAKDLWRYVLITPAGRKLAFREPDPKIASHRREEHPAGAVHVFEALDLDPAPVETGMPGDTAGVDYLHVSTYGTWDELGEWYRGLVRNQLLTDARIEAQVRELTRGLGDDRARTAAIYGWVVTATRYVGLEFGIHGYKPYRAPLVVSRGFGDCKDKASLLVTMLRYAGIEADLALVRTRSLGPLDELPASLSVFNHAIAYVPSLDLWLDGTAEHHGTADLPFEDQGVLALLVKRDGVKLVRTPVLDSSTSSSRESYDVLLDADGDARIEAETTVRGVDAPRLRVRFEAEATRRERFEAALAARFPGSRLGELSFDDLAALEQPVRYRYDAFVPGYGRATGGVLKILVDPGANLTKRYARSARRDHPLEIGAPRRAEVHQSLRLPTGYRPVALPPTAIIDSRFGKLVLEIEDRGDRIEIARKLDLRAHQVSADDYPEFAEFCRAVDEALGGRINLERAP